MDPEMCGAFAAAEFGAAAGVDGVPPSLEDVDDAEPPLAVVPSVDGVAEVDEPLDEPAPEAAGVEVELCDCVDDEPVPEAGVDAEAGCGLSTETGTAPTTSVTCGTFAKGSGGAFVELPAPCPFAVGS